MAQSSPQSSSSSPAPHAMSSNAAISLSTSRNVVDSIQYRRNIFVDGDRISISETPLRRPREFAAHVPLQDYPDQPIGSSGKVVLQTNAATARQPPIIHQSISSSVEESPRTRHDSFIDIASSVNESWCMPSRQSSKVSSQQVEIPPPPTPRVQRLPTPDLEPLKVNPFCGCQPCISMAALSIEEKSRTHTNMGRCREGATGDVFDRWYM